MSCDPMKFSDILKEKIEGNAGLRNLIESGDATYPHFTLRVHSIYEYIGVISAINELLQENEDYNFLDYLIFRGTSNRDWGLCPSLFRLSKYDLFTECDITNEFATKRPEAFDNCPTDFELLAKMQHYGLPTRLLDFSENPLVALYFACENNDGIDGRMLCHNTEMSITNMDVINMICGLYRNTVLEDSIPMEHYFENTQITILEYLNKTCNLFPLVARPQYWNQRIKNQSAVFMIFPNSVHDEYSHAGFLYFEGSLKSDGELVLQSKDKWNRRVKRVYLHESNRSIYKDHPDYLVTYDIWTKICESYGEVSKYIDGHYTFNDNILGNFKERFSFTTNYKPVEEKALQNLFFSIIVDGKCKHRILDELASIGIDIAFIYPELEYTAKKIKSRYI